MATAFDSPVKQGNEKSEGTAPVVVVDNVLKSFGRHTVLHGISLSVGRGETLAVLGRSGTGKSVLLRLIIGLEKPDSGSVRIHGQDIAGLALDQLGEIRKKMGFPVSACSALRLAYCRGECCIPPATPPGSNVEVRAG